MIAFSDRLFGSSLPLRAAGAAAAVLVVAWFAWELVRDERVAVIAVFVVAFSPFVWVQSASLLGYNLSFVLAIAAAAALLRAVRTRSRRAGVAAGLFIGAGAFHRPFDGLLAIGPVAVYAIVQARRQHALATLTRQVVAGAAPFAIVFLAYNRALMGSVTTMTFGSSGTLDRFGFGWRASFDLPLAGRSQQIHYTVGTAFATVVKVLRVLPSFVGFAPALVIAFVLLFRRRRRDGRAYLLAAMVAATIVGYFFWWGTANEFHFGLEHALGPFYHYVLLAPLAVGGAWGFLQLRSRNGRVALVALGLAWTLATGTLVMRDAIRNGDARDTQLAAIAAPNHSVVLDPPEAPGDPYLSVANQVPLRGRVVAVDVPGRRLEALDRLPGYTPFVVRDSHRFNDPFGPTSRALVPITLERAPAIGVHLHATSAFGAARAYLRIGTRPAQLAAGGGTVVDASWLINAAMLTGEPTEIAIGVTTQRGTAVPRAMTESWFECRFEARALPGGNVEMLTPCAGWHHYEFPGGGKATVAENLPPTFESRTSV